MVERRRRWSSGSGFDGARDPRVARAPIDREKDTTRRGTNVPGRCTDRCVNYTVDVVDVEQIFGVSTSPDGARVSSAHARPAAE